MAFWKGTVYIMYSSEIIPQISMVIHAILPGMLNLLSPEVLPAPYQDTTHCRVVNCCSQFCLRRVAMGVDTKGKNWNTNTTHSQFSRDGGIQFSMEPMVMISGCLREDLNVVPR